MSSEKNEGALSGIDFDLIDFDRLYRMGGEVLKPIPKPERADYRYWRGASLAKIAVNLARGQKHINAGSDEIVHFSESYAVARSNAKAMSNNPRIKTQLSKKERQALAEATGHEKHAALPSIILALSSQLNHLELEVTEGAPTQAVVYRGFVTIEMLDPYSREALLGLYRGRSS